MRRGVRKLLDHVPPLSQMRIRRDGLAGTRLTAVRQTPEGAHPGDLAWVIGKFRDPRPWIGALMSAVMISQPDITLTLDLEGVIREASVGSGFADEFTRPWIGRPWADTVTGTGGANVRRMLEEARAGGVSAFGQVTQRFPSGRESPVEYTTVRLGGAAGLIAVGKNLQAVIELQSRLLAAQQAREQDYWKLREIETRYRMLFDASNEAVLLIRVEQLRVLEANPSAIRALGLAPGQEFLPELAPAEREPFRALLARVRELGRVPGILVHLGHERAPWFLRAQLFAAEPGPVFLLQLSPAGVGAAVPDTGLMPAAAGLRAEPGAMEPLIERLSDGVVVLDQQGLILRANSAFLDLVQAGAEAVVRGESLGRWLRQPGADLGVLMGMLHRNRTVRLFAGTLQGELGTDCAVEISAVGETDTNPRRILVLLRDVSCRLPGEPVNRRLALAHQENDQPMLPDPYAGWLREDGASDPAARMHGELPAEMIQRLGRTKLPELVKESARQIERRYIEAALDQAGGNRTVAADLLGLSRQSLYVKLARYGFDSAGEAGAAGEAGEPARLSEASAA